MPVEPAHVKVIVLYFDCHLDNVFLLLVLLMFIPLYIIMFLLRLTILHDSKLNFG